MIETECHHFCNEIWFGFKRNPFYAEVSAISLSRFWSGWIRCGVRVVPSFAAKNGYGCEKIHESFW